MNEYPRDKLNADDQGALAVAIAVKDKTVIVDFGKPINWLGFDADSARNLARTLLRRAAPRTAPYALTRHQGDARQIRSCCG